MIEGNEGVFRIPQNSSITGASPSDSLVSYQGYSLGEFYPSAEMQSVYSTAPADRAHCKLSSMSPVPLQDILRKILTQVCYEESPLT